MSISNTPEFPTLDDETYYEPPKRPSNADMLLGDDILGIPHVTQLAIFLNGKRIEHFLHFELIQSATTHHHFTLTLAHDSLGIAQDHHMEDAQKLQGKRIKTWFNYKGLPNGPYRDFSGIITGVGFSKRKESFGHIILSGYSPTILLDAAVHSQSFGGKQTTNLASIANNVIKEGIDMDTYKVRIEPSYTGHLSYSCQYEETHYNFLARTAEAYGEQFFYDGEILHFGKLPLPEKAIKLTHGHDVFHVSVCMKARHVKRSFYGYNSSTHEQLTSPETRINHQSSLAKSAYEISEKTFLTPSLDVAPIKASTHQDVETSQRGASGSLATTVFTTSGQTRVPFLYPGCLIDLHMRQPYSRDSRYFTQLMVTQITHSVDNLGHYIGYFEAIAAGTGYLPTPKFEMPKTGTQYATVTDNMNDQGRVRVRFDWQWDYLTTDWIRVLSPDAGSSEQVPQNRGFLAVPEIGDRVMIKFIHGHPDRPFVAGGIFHGKVAAGGGPGNNIKSWSSKSGHIIELNDAGGITIRDKTGGNQILIDGQHTISLSAIKTIELSNGKSSLKIEGNKISLHANKIEIAGRNGEPASKIAIKALNTLLYGKDSIKIQSDKQVIISSKGLTRVIAKTDLTISGEHTTIRSKVMTNIMGNPINLISTGPQAAPKANAAAPVTTFKIDAKPELASSGMHPQAQTGAIQRTIIDAPPEQKPGRPENMVLFVNGYRSGPSLTKGALEHSNSDNIVSTIDRYKYWEGLDTQFYRRLNSGTIFYADGHHSISTSNHRTMPEFIKSAKNTIHSSSDLQEVSMKYVGHFLDSPSASVAIAEALTPAPFAQIITAGRVAYNLLAPGELNIKSNRAGFQERRKNGLIAAQSLLYNLEKCKISARKQGKDLTIQKLDIVAHSMGYAYALGMLDALKGKIPLGRFYIIAPENAEAGEIDLNDFEEVWQYGANLGEPNADPLHQQDGVAPQTPVKGLKQIKDPIREKRGRAFIPQGEPKGFLQSHSIGNYKWIFTKIQEGRNGYVKIRD